MNVSQFLAVKKALALDMLQKQKLLISQAAPASPKLLVPTQSAEAMMAEQQMLHPERFNLHKNPPGQSNPYNYY